MPSSEHLSPGREAGDRVRPRYRRDSMVVCLLGARSLIRQYGVINLLSLLALLLAEPAG